MLSENSQKELKPQRKLRRGSSFPCLFILCIWRHFLLWSQSVFNQELFMESNLSTSTYHFTLILYRWHCYIWRATTEEAFQLANILRKYEEASRQRINFHKLELSFSWNVPTTSKNELIQLLKVKAIERHDNYLGLPTMVGRLNTEIFNFVKEIVWKKLKGWKKKKASVKPKHTLWDAFNYQLPYVKPHKEHDNKISLSGGEDALGKAHQIQRDRGIGFRSFT